METALVVPEQKEHELPCIRFRPPKRPNYGRIGREIILRTNYYRMKIVAEKVQHYSVEMSTTMCSRKTNREIFTRFLATYPDHFADMHPVYDGKENMYTKKLLPLDHQNLSVVLLVPVESGGRPRLVTVSVKWVGEISLMSNDNLKYEAIQVIDTILRHVPSLRYATIGKSFYYKPLPDQGLSLGGGREIWMGYHQSTKLTRKGCMLNVDVSAAAFHTATPVIEFLAKVLDLPEHLRISVMEQGITHSQHHQFSKAIKNLFIELSHFPTRSRIRKVINVTEQPADELIIDKNLPDGSTKRCTVAQHFLEQHRITLQYPHLPCLQVGLIEFPTYFPIEVCILADYQRCVKKLTEGQKSQMIWASAKPAPDRMRAISKQRDALEFEQDPCINDFGINVSSNMTELNGRVLRPPSLIYSDHKSPQNDASKSPTDGAWDMRPYKFLDGIHITCWAIACFAEPKEVHEDCLTRYVHLLRKISQESGVPITEYPVFCKYGHGVEEVELVLRFLKQTYPDLQLVLVILPGKHDFYPEVKRVGDTLLGVTTQCVQAKNVVKTFAKTAANICLKINAKLGGVNCILNPQYRPQIFNESVIFLGCNVTNITVTDTAIQSVVSIVGSMDAHPSKYAATVRVQDQQDLIKDMAAMVKELLLRFHRNTGFKPSRIVVYRDAALESMFHEVLQYELRAIREACKMIENGYEPGITFIAVMKRHHTRLFAKYPMHQTGQSRNIPPGTTVDCVITHPTQFEFFLCSHAGIQGTSRPTRYYVLWDDNKMPADEMQQMTYQLCHTYVRCNRAVSIPAPAYYAILVCTRAKIHLWEREQDREREGGSEDSARLDLSHLARAVQVSTINSKIVHNSKNFRL
ncbi:hypothetical protein GCK72_007595 [Caenorhabditis remanei]|uniref:Piwi domain-containing protein n=1 Tax=Caenorhabditis remanei TaxID=31234 RepID=A0A6A5HLT4_CAERE|nr:hypothetical protein GCK72_007595 [Caenorhabditis remanei]KAF1767636.1 hypothetical protein GCK72_007595 [Caenorhabditis remanei]